MKKKNFICGLDIGTFKICATCAGLDSDGKIVILASQTIPTQGIRSGRIIDSKKLSNCIRDIAQDLHKMCGMKVRRVYVNIDSPDVQAKPCGEKLFFKERTRIEKTHIERLVNSAISSNLSLNRRLIHTGTKNFIIDNQTHSINPEGHSATEIQLNIVIVSAYLQTVNSIIKCIKDAGLILTDMIPSGYAQAQGFYKDFQTNGEKNNFLIDVGAGLTKLTVFKDGLVKNIVILPLGVGSITENIATKLNVSCDCAEQLKTKYGRVYCEDSSINQRIIVRDKATSKTLRLQPLFEIVNSKINFLLHQTKKELLKLNYQFQEDSQNIITGGGSILEGFLEKAEEVLGSHVKMGFLSEIKDKHIQAQSALYATSIGLIQYGFQNRNRIFTHEKIGFGCLKGLLARTKQLYREYF